MKKELNKYIALLTLISMLGIALVPLAGFGGGIDTGAKTFILNGGSSSFDMAPKPYNKYYALDLYCKENGYNHNEVVFIGDDYGLGGNDESVYKSDFKFLTVDNYLDFPNVVSVLF